MSMALDYRPQPSVGGMGYDQHKYPHPHFTNPWQAPAAPSNPLYHSQYQAPAPMEHHPAVTKTQTPVTMGYVANPAASSLGSDLVPTRSYGPSYGSSATSNPAYTATSSAKYSPEQVPTSHPYGYGLERRESHPSSNNSTTSFSDEMAGARGMVAMANSTDVTPRNIYNTNGARSGSHDSYGFPATTHSHHSSISSASPNGYPPFYASSYNGSVDSSSVTDYSSSSDDMPRPLPPPSQLMNGFPPEPQAMMNQFNAKVNPNTQKKHKCRICEKRFTRPSSLQTHMYSHTGEKPFACDHAGCGRHFSVVSNLRRHKKVHKEDGAMSNDDE